MNAKFGVIIAVTHCKIKKKHKRVCIVYDVFDRARRNVNTRIRGDLEESDDE